MAALYIYCFPFLNNWANTSGKTPMHIAAQLGHTPMVQFLIDSDANKDLTDAQGNTPLHYASAYGHVETLKLLLESGCTFSMRNAEGFTAAEFAFTERVFVELESTARAVSEGRRRQRRDERRTPVNERSEQTLGGRIRSGSVSTSGSGLVSNAGSSSAHGSQGSGRHPQGYGLASGSPNLMDRNQYFDTVEATPRAVSSRGQTPPFISRRSSEGVSERSSSQVLASSQSTAPPVPPLPAGSRLQPPRPPHRSPSLPVHPAVMYPMVFPTQDDASQASQSAMRRSRSAQNGEANLNVQATDQHQRFQSS